MGPEACMKRLMTSTKTLSVPDGLTTLIRASVTRTRAGH